MSDESKQLERMEAAITKLTESVNALITRDEVSLEREKAANKKLDNVQSFIDKNRTGILFATMLSNGAKAIFTKVILGAIFLGAIATIANSLGYVKLTDKPLPKEIIKNGRNNS